jgi:hypothetical protein
MGKPIEQEASNWYDAWRQSTATASLLQFNLNIAEAALRDIAKGLHMIESREVAQKALDAIGGEK